MIVLIKLLEKVLGQLVPHYGTLYRRIGGAKVIDKLVDDFYHIMATDPAAKECLATHHGRDLKVSGEKLKAFLSGWLGGPQLFLEKYGHPRLRARHFPFAIGEAEAQQWLYCMQHALKRSSISEDSQTQLMQAFEGLTQLIKNRPA